MNFSQNNQYPRKEIYNPNKEQKASKNLYQNAGYGSSATNQQYNYNYKNNNNNYASQNIHYPIEDQTKQNERPLWSYREIKYDQFKMPMNTENITTKKIKKPEVQPEIPRKSNLEQLQDEDKKYFNNMKYQKVKVTKKVKHTENNQQKIQKKGPLDDYEQQYYNNEQINNMNNEFMGNKNDQINNYYENDNKNEENIENINDEDEEGEIELAQKDIQEEYDKIIDYNEDIYNNQNMNYNEEEPKQDINDNQNQIHQNEINDDELQKDNYDLDIENLAETHSQNEKEENENIPLSQENYNENKNIQDNQQIRPRPDFNEIITQKVTFPEGSLESWNCAADYIPK